MAAVPSELAGTTGIWIVAAVAILVAVADRARALEPARLRGPACAALAMHIAHCSEEYLTGFPRLFPPLLRLMPWSGEFFLGFNACWLAVWGLAAGAAWLGRLSVAARAALWMLALISLVNMIAHPVLAIAAGGYFPGLVTSLPLGLAGAWLALRMCGR